MTILDRRTVLLTGGFAAAHGSLALARGATGMAATGVITGAAAGAVNPRPGAATEVPPFFPSTDPEVVGAVVGAAHTDLDTVVELVTARPHLSRATVDWGFGDWESALGAASHMGRRDIAEFLIEHGARPDIFSAAMLGQLGVVKALVEASPGVQRIPGPHDFTLLHHARMGGDDAAPVLAYLEALGDADLRPESVALSDEQRLQFVGTYGFEAAGNNTLDIEDLRGTLSLKRSGAPFGRRIFPVADTEFYTSGSPTVRVVFEVADGNVTGLRIIDNEVILTATRQAG